MLIIRVLEISGGPLFSCRTLCMHEMRSGIQNERFRNSPKAKLNQREKKQQRHLLMFSMAAGWSFPLSRQQYFPVFGICPGRFVKSSDSYLRGTLPERGFFLLFFYLSVVSVSADVRLCRNNGQVECIELGSKGNSRSFTPWKRFSDPTALWKWPPAARQGSRHSAPSCAPVPKKNYPPLALRANEYWNYSRLYWIKLFMAKLASPGRFCSFFFFFLALRSLDVPMLWCSVQDWKHSCFQ